MRVEGTYLRSLLQLEKSKEKRRKRKGKREKRRIDMMYTRSLALANLMKGVLQSYLAGVLFA